MFKFFLVWNCTFLASSIRANRQNHNIYACKIRYYTTSGLFTWAECSISFEFVPQYGSLILSRGVKEHCSLSSLTLSLSCSHSGSLSSSPPHNVAVAACQNYAVNGDKKLNEYYQVKKVLSLLRGVFAFCRPAYFSQGGGEGSWKKSSFCSEQTSNGWINKNKVLTQNYTDILLLRNTKIFSQYFMGVQNELTVWVVHQSETNG